MQESHKNWSKQLKSQKNKRNDPNQTVKLRGRERPKTVQLHPVLKIRKSLFQEPNVCTIIGTKASAFTNRSQNLEIMNTRNFIDVR